MIWWLIPVIATLAAWMYTRFRGPRGGRVRPRPEPGSPEDARDLARFAAALRSGHPEGGAGQPEART